MMKYNALHMMLGVLLVSGCTPTETLKKQEEDPKATNGKLTNNTLTLTPYSMTRDNQLVQINRYSVIEAAPTQAQADILKVIIKVTLPEEIHTVGEAIRYLLKRSGYKLAPPSVQGEEVAQLFGKKMPDIHRTLGPMALDKALLTLTGPAFHLQTDTVHRLIAYELTPTHKTKEGL